MIQPHPIGGEPPPTNFRRRKPELRKRLRQQRNALSPAQQAQAAIALAERIKTLPAFQHSQSIALYMVNDGEIDPGKVLAWSLAHGKRCYAPVVARARAAALSKPRCQPHKNSLRFAEITAHSKFQRNQLGIAEPLVAADELLAAEQLDLILLPLVGFDGHGNRLGMGGSFYDATLAFKKAAPHRRPQLVGLAHEMQRVEKIDAENWDIPLATVVTEQRIYHCAKLPTSQAARTRPPGVN